MANRILLTGAGFTHNFGAPLSKKMSDLIFNNDKIQSNSQLLNIVRDNSDYEDIYQEIMQSNDNQTGIKDLLNEIIKNTYKKVDDRILHDIKQLTKTCSDLFNKLIIRFSKPYGGAGFIFTLNQDLFIERKFDHYTNPRVPLICLPVMGSSVYGSVDELDDKNKIILPQASELNDKKKSYEKKLNKNNIQLSYIKLHGSQEWFKNDSNQMMIIGRSKYAAMKSEPLLTWYFDFLKEQLSMKNTKLLIIGYGFCDEHINEAIHEGNKNNNLKIYIIDSESRTKLMNKLKKKQFGNEISKLIHSYYPTTLCKMFPNDPTSKTHPDWDQLENDFFNS